MNSSKFLFVGFILRAVFSTNTYERDSRIPQVILRNGHPFTQQTAASQTVLKWLGQNSGENSGQNSGQNSG
jgi:hypothetical protein